MTGHVSRGHGELEDDAEQDAEGDDAEDDPHDHEVSRAAAEAGLLVQVPARHRGHLLGLPHGQFARGAVLGHHHPRARPRTVARVVAAGAANLAVPEAGHAGVQRPPDKIFSVLSLSYT